MNYKSLDYSYKQGDPIKQNHIGHEELCTKCDTFYVPWITGCNCEKITQWDKKKFDFMIDMLVTEFKGEEK